MISTKAAATMHYIHLKGSPVQRRAIRDEKVKAFAEDMEKSFEGKAFLTKKELKTLVQKHTQGLSVKVRSLPNWFTQKSNRGALTGKRWLFFNRGFDIDFPFEKIKGVGTIIRNKASEKESIRHEMSHVFTTASIPNVFRFFIKSIGDNFRAANFYHAKIYTEYNSLESTHEFRHEITRAGIFTPEMRPSDRVEILQGWRHTLEDERDAYRNGLENYRQGDVSAHSHCEDGKKWLQKLKLDDKIEYLKALILEERAKQVASHKPISQHQP